MSDTRFIFLMIMLFTVLFTIMLGSIIVLIDMNTKNVDKANVSCEIKTNQCLHVTAHKIVE